MQRLKPFETPELRFTGSGQKQLYVMFSRRPQTVEPAIARHRGARKSGGDSGGAGACHLCRVRPGRCRRAAGNRAGHPDLPVAHTASTNKRATRGASNCSTQARPFSRLRGTGFRRAMEREDPRRQCRGALRFHQGRVRSHLGDGRRARRHDRLTGRHGFQQHDAEAFLDAGQAEDVGAIVLGGQVGTRNIAQPGDRVRLTSAGRPARARRHRRVRCRRCGFRGWESRARSSAAASSSRPTRLRR